MPLSFERARPVRVFIALLVFHLFLLSLQVPLGSQPNILEKSVFAVFTPLQHGVVAVVRFLGRLWRSYFYFHRVQQQNQELRDDIFQLRQENAALRRSLEAMSSSEELRRFLASTGRPARIASVVSLDPSNFKKSLILDQGRLAGIVPDMVVLDRNGRLVGRVVEPISLTEATVQLITDEASGVGVFIRGDKGIGVLSGDGRGGCRLKYILSTTEGIVPGDEVLTSGYDGIYPRGLPVGRVASVGQDASLFKTIAVTPHFLFHELSPLAILLPGADRADREPLRK